MIDYNDKILYKYNKASPPLSTLTGIQCSLASGKFEIRFAFQGNNIQCSEKEKRIYRKMTFFQFLSFSCIIFNFLLDFLFYF
jgi:hypothetical protein